MRTLRHGFLLALMIVMACAGAPSSARSQTTLSPDQLEDLVAPVALYPDALVAQVLPASTHPVQVVDAARAVAERGRPTEAQASQWDPSVQALVSFPTVLKMMNDKLDWTTRLGQAVATDQSGVMAAIQSVRLEAFRAGNLHSNDKQDVQVQGLGQGGGESTTIVIEPANPQVIYVPQYNPAVIVAPPPTDYYGDAAAPASGLVTFGMGFAAGAATAYACDWGHGSAASVTVNNTYAYSATNAYPAYHSMTGTYGAYNPNTGSSAAYHSTTGADTGYDAKTGTYGAYNPETGKYATYNPSTGEYNKDGTTGTYEKPSSTADDNAKTGTDSGYNSKTGTYGAYNPETGKYGTYNPSTGAYNKDGTTGTSDKPSSTGSASDGGAGSSGARSEGFSHEGSDGGGFRGAGGGGWGAREASARGARSFGDSRSRR